jgi:hypothetical protein
VLADFSPTTLERAAAGIEPYLGRPREVLRERSRSLHDLKRANEAYDGIYRRMLCARVEA